MRTSRTTFRPVDYRLLIAAGAIVLSGCSNVTVPIVETGHLNPVVQRYPVIAGVYFDGEFQEFLHTEERVGGNNWEVYLGDAQATLFDRILDASFNEHIVVDDLENIDAYDVDFVIYPRVIEYAYLSPEDSGSDFYAVSIKYAFKIFDESGEEVTNWTVTAYGKNRSTVMRRKESLSEATNIALRDAAAAVIVEFESNGELIALLNPNPEIGEPGELEEPVDESGTEAADSDTEAT